MGILLLLGLVKHIGAFVPFIGRHAFTIAAAVQLYVPVFSLDRRGITRESLGIDRGTDWRWFLRDTAIVGALAMIVTVPFAIGHHFWQTELFHHPFRPRMPENFWSGVVAQVFIVALAEEIYFRGYLQERLRRIWPPERTLFGIPFGKAIIVASAVFALAHFVGEYRFERLGPFFPGLVFGLLREKTGRIYAPILFHAYCNVLGEVLWACYRP